MRILSNMRHDLYYYTLGLALESLGYPVYHLRVYGEEEYEAAIREFQPDVFIDMGWELSLEDLPLLTQVLKRNHLFHIYFAEEDWLYFETWSKPYVLATQPEFIFTRSKQCITKYEEMGFRAAYLDVGCNPLFHRSYPVHENFSCDISAIGHSSVDIDTFRRKSISDLIIPLFDQPYQINIWGNGWEAAAEFFGKTPASPMFKGKLDFIWTPYVYSSSKINISLQTCEDQISNRTYDILATGGFLLTSDTPGVLEKLKPGVHCVVSQSPAETIELISYYLEHPEERQKIAQAGQEYVCTALSYQKTLPGVWTYIEKALQHHRYGGLRS